jgi:hypothetical protein
MARKTFTKEQILAEWKKSVQSGLGANKRLVKAIRDKHEPLLLATIAKRLADPKNDYGRDRNNTKAVARTVGQMCRMLTDGRDVQLAVFEEVFALCNTLHPRCPGGGGSGKWCN